LEYLDYETALNLTLARNHEKISANQSKSTGRDKEFNIDTYKNLYELYLNSGLDVNFTKVRAEFYGPNMRPYYDGENYLLDWNFAQNHYLDYVCGLVTKQIKKPSTIIDLGAGTGEIVRYISRAIDAHFVVADKSIYALDLVKLVNSREGYNIDTVRIDFAEGAVKVPSDAFVLSTYSLMYLEQNSTQFFSSLLESNPQGGLFLEPIYSDQSTENSLSNYRRDYFLECGYSTDFLNSFHEVCIQFGYRISFHHANVLAHNLLLPVSAIGWERVDN
jgi:SAM-dependent methyltransferase